MSGSDSDSYVSSVEDTKKTIIKKQAKVVKSAKVSSSEESEESENEEKSEKEEESEKEEKRPAAKRKRKDNNKGKEIQNPVDLSGIVDKNDLKKDDLYYITINQPKTLQHIIAGIVPLIEKDAYLVIRDDTLCLDAFDDQNIALITMRLSGIEVVLSDEAKKMMGDTPLFFKVNLNRFYQGLRIVRTYQSLKFNKKKNSRFINLVSFDSDYVGHASYITLPDDTSDEARSEYRPLSLSEEAYTWHIENIDVKELHDIIQRAMDFKSDISVKIYESLTKDEYFLRIGAEANDGSQISIINRISESVEEVEDDNGVKTERKIFKMKQATSMATSDIIEKLDVVNPIYDELFANRYLSNFMKASEQSSVMSLHFKEHVDKRKHPMIMTYTVGSIKTKLSYLKFALAPKKKKE